MSRAPDVGAPDALETALARRLHRFDCPSPQALGDYALGLLGDEPRASLVDHVGDCPRCSEELATLRRYLSVDPAERLAPIDRLRRVLATLVPAPSRAVALRGSADDATQTYRADHVVVTLGGGPITDRRPASVVGLIWSETGETLPIAGGEARLTGVDGSVRASPLTDVGNFELAEVGPGIYELEIRLGDRVVVVESLRVG